MILRKLFSASSSEAATQRWTMSASRQRVTRSVRRRTPALGLSMMLVVAKQRHSDGGTPKRLMVKHSSAPSRNAAAAAGQSRSYHSAGLASFAKPCLASSFQAARTVALACSR